MFWKVETVMEKWKISPGNTVDCNLFFLIMSLISVILAQIIKNSTMENHTFLHCVALLATKQ